MTEAKDTEWPSGLAYVAHQITHGDIRQSLWHIEPAGGGCTGLEHARTHACTAGWAVQRSFYQQEGVCSSTEDETIVRTRRAYPAIFQNILREKDLSGCHLCASGG